MERKSKLTVLLIIILAAAVAVGCIALKNKKNNDENSTTEDSWHSVQTEQQTTEKTAEKYSITEIVETATSENETQTSESEKSNSESTSTDTSASEKSKTDKSSEKSTDKTTDKSTSSFKSTTKSTTKKSTTKNTTTQKVQNITYIKGVLVVNKTYALPENYAPGVNSEAKKAFDSLAADAAKEGLNLYIRSGYRSYSYQKDLYNNYVARDGKAAADRYSARPGHSEHQTGLAFDINSLSQSFENTPEGKWLAKNCWKYGFIIRYPKGKESITGYMYEPWHIRYLGKDTAKAVYDSGLTLEEYLGIDSKYKN